MSSGGLGNGRIVLGISGSGESDIQFFDKLLQAFLVREGEAGELDAHAYSSITGPDYTCGLYFLGFYPESNVQSGGAGQRHEGLHITAAATYVCGVGSHEGTAAALIAEFDGKIDFVTEKVSLVLGL